MTARQAWAAVFGIALVLTGLLAAAPAGNRWSRYEHEMQDPVDDPGDANEKTEFAFARLRYRSNRDGWGYARWGIDCNKSDRQFIAGLRRLTRVHARSIEEIIDVEDDEIFNWPWLFAVSPGDWQLTDAHCARLKQYLDRGGFLMVDDFHGPRDWDGFMSGISRIAPNAQIVELPNDSPIFHVLYNLSDRVQIPGANVVHGRGYEKDGVVPHWRGVLDAKGRVMVAACFNMDVGDAWEFADSADYPEKFTSQAYRLGINYVLYSMTH